ncbi:MAG: methyltransferase domain-containing protein [Deltaproteobacteria bacterium]|nr:methyltransferase domain-containing protein [Deltaproteobacteria bacterium]
MIPVKSVESLMEAAHGYQTAMILFTALRFDVFSALAEGARDAGGLARRLPADPRNLSILLNALVAMGLLEKTGSKYRNARVARDFLADGPRSKRSILLHHLDCWPDWTLLERKIRGNRRGRREGSDFQENFIRGMEDNARERAAQVAVRFPLRAGERVLDLGGGPGTYAVEWAKRYPGAEVTVYDIPETLRVTRKILKEKGAARLIRLAEGDFTRDPLGGPFDFIWISHIFHAYSEKDCIALLRKARRALAPGGRIAVQEFLLDESKTAPPGPAFFSVHMVAVTEGGRAYSAGEIASMLKSAGFVKISSDKPDPRGVGVVTARA